MAMVRRISVGFQAANRSIKEVDVVVPASAVPDDYREALDLLELPEVKRRLSLGGPMLYVKVSDPYDDAPFGVRIG